MARLPKEIFRICATKIQKVCGNPRQNRACAKTTGKSCFATEMKKRGIKKAK